MYYFLTYEIPMFKNVADENNKTIVKREWVSVVPYAVYLHHSFTEIVIENEKCNLNNTVG